MATELRENTLAVFGYPAQLPNETGAEYEIFKRYMQAGSLANLQESLKIDIATEVDSSGRESVVTYSRARQLNETFDWQRRKREYRAYVADQTARVQADLAGPELTAYGLSVKSQAIRQMDLAGKFADIIESRLTDIYKVNVVDKDPKHKDYIPVSDLLGLFAVANKTLEQSRLFYEAALGVRELQKAVQDAVKASGATGSTNNLDSE